MGCAKCSIVSCPKELIGREVIAAEEDFEFAEQGFLPAAGGIVDQTDSFLAMWKFWREYRAMRAMKPD